MAMERFDGYSGFGCLMKVLGRRFEQWMTEAITVEHRDLAAQSSYIYKISTL